MDKEKDTTSSGNDENLKPEEKGERVDKNTTTTESEELSRKEFLRLSAPLDAALNRELKGFMRSSDEAKAEEAGKGKKEVTEVPNFERTGETVKRTVIDAGVCTRVILVNIDPKIKEIGNSQTYSSEDGGWALLGNKTQLEASEKWVNQILLVKTNIDEEVVHMEASHCLCVILVDDVSGNHQKFLNTKILRVTKLNTHNSAHELRIKVFDGNPQVEVEK